MREKQAFNNAKWIIACKIAQSILQLIIGMICARYLGPSNYGLINYAASIVAFVMPLMKLGLDSTLVSELVENPHKEGEVMGTSLLMNTISSLLCIGGVTAFASIANFGETETIIVCILYSTSLFFAALEMMQYWFQYKLISKYSSIVMLISYVVVSAYKIFLLVTAKSVYWFALSNSLDFCVIGVSLIAIYLKKGDQRLSFSWSRGKKMLSRSRYYILASLIIVVIQNTDHVMLTNMIGKAENGIYSAAITSATVAQFVYMAIIDSYRPLILENKKNDQKAYETDLSRLYCVISYMALAQGIVFTLFAPFIIGLLYGSEYAGAVPVLQILVWYIAFAIMGTVRNIWLLAEKKEKYLWRINLFGALMNIALNAFMIPLWGACGAAFASFLTQFFANFILGFILKPIRENNKLILRGLNPKFLITESGKILKILRKKS